MKILKTELENLCRILTLSENDDSLDAERIAEVTISMNKKIKLKNFCDLNKIKYRAKTNQYYIYINRKQITGKSETDLIDKLYVLYCGDSTITLEQAFNEWMIWRKSISTNSKTLKENLNEWNRYISNAPISKVRVASLTIKDFEDYYYAITSNYSITNKRLSNITTVLNGVMKRTVSLGIVQHNILTDVDKKPFQKRCMPDTSKKEIYSLADRERILKYLSDKTDIYSLAISLSFYFCLRIGELCAIKYSDVKKDAISIARSKRYVQQMNEDFTFTKRAVTNEPRIKGNKSTGFRDYPLLEKSKKLIERIHSLYPNDEFLLMSNGRQINGDTFNEKLKSVCTELNIPYLSSHQIRFTVATMLFENGVPITQISMLLGHADTATTWRYVRQQRTSAQTLAIMNNVLG